MGRRGSKSYEQTGNKLLPLRLVAKQLGISLRTCETDYRSALDKLKHIPGAFELILAQVHAVADSERDCIQCGSVECNRYFLELFADKEDNRGKKKEER